VYLITQTVHVMTAMPAMHVVVYFFNLKRSIPVDWLIHYCSVNYCICVDHGATAVKMSRNFLLISLTGLVALILSCINIGVGIFHLRPESTATLPLLRTQSTKSITVTRTTEPIPRPPLHTIVHKEWNITGDASWLLNYAIVGFPKCGTSTLMFHLQNHSQVQMFGDERCDVAYDQVPDAVGKYKARYAQLSKMVQ
jgi:hypothetical protein